MTRKKGTGGIATLTSQHARILLLLILVLSLVLPGCQAVVNRNDLHQQQRIYVGSAVSEIHEEDPIISLLGKTFQEIKQVLGEPDEQGFEEWLGPHHYILYRFGKGFIQFCSPESKENGIVVSIYLGPGMVVLGAKVGMSFQEIVGVLGEPDSGPGLGMDNFYYADYFSGETNHEVPDIFISFVALSMNSPTEYALIKWEAFEDEETEILQTEK
ncbi:MAG: hypothetical protein R6W96_09105 [Clostridia bacterium]